MRERRGGREDRRPLSPTPRSRLRSSLPRRCSVSSRSARVRFDHGASRPFLLEDPLATVGDASCRENHGDTRCFRVMEIPVPSPLLENEQSRGSFLARLYTAPPWPAKVARVTNPRLRVSSVSETVRGYVRLCAVFLSVQNVPGTSNFSNHVRTCRTKELIVFR